MDNWSVIVTNQILSTPLNMRSIEQRKSMRTRLTCEYFEGCQTPCLTALEHRMIEWLSIPGTQVTKRHINYKLSLSLLHNAKVFKKCIAKHAYLLFCEAECRGKHGREDMNQRHSGLSLTMPTMR